MAELCSSDTCRRHRRCSAEFGLPNSAVGMICSRHEALVLCFVHRRRLSRRARSFSPVVQRHKREFPSIQTFTRVISHRDQALVNQGQIRIGMSRPAVWLAWGTPDRKIIGNMGGGPTETWIYTYYASYPYYPYYDPLDDIFRSAFVTIRFVIRGSRKVSLILARS